MGAIGNNKKKRIPTKVVPFEKQKRVQGPTLPPNFSTLQDKEDSDNALKNNPVNCESDDPLDQLLAHMNSRTNTNNNNKKNKNAFPTSNMSPLDQLMGIINPSSNISEKKNSDLSSISSKSQNGNTQSKKEFENAIDNLLDRTSKDVFGDTKTHRKPDMDPIELPG